MLGTEPVNPGVILFSFFNSQKEKLRPMRKREEYGPILFLSSIFINSELQIRNVKSVWREEGKRSNPQ